MHDFRYDIEQRYGLPVSDDVNEYGGRFGQPDFHEWQITLAKQALRSSIVQVAELFIMAELRYRGDGLRQFRGHLLVQAA